MFFASGIFFVFLIFINFSKIQSKDFYSESQILWENYYSSLISDSIYKSFRYNTKLISPSFIIHPTNNKPCELFSFTNNNPSIQTIYSNIRILDNNIQSNNTDYYFNEKLKCFTSNEEDCIFNLPIPRCTDNDSPNLPETNKILSLIDRGFNVKNSLKSYISSKQSYFHYTSSFLPNYGNTRQFNRIDQYWNGMIENLKVTIESFIELSQPEQPKNIKLLLDQIDNGILSSENKSLIIDQTSASVNIILESLNKLLELVDDLQFKDPSTVVSTIPTDCLKIFKDSELLLGYQLSNVDIFFGKSNKFANQTTKLYESGHTLLEYYLEFTTSSNLIEMVTLEIISLNNQTNVISDQQKSNFNRFGKLKLNLESVLSYIKSSVGIDESSTLLSNYFTCDSNIIGTIINSYNLTLDPAVSFNSDGNQLFTHGDIAFCRDLISRVKSNTMDFTISNLLTSNVPNKIGDSSSNQNILSYQLKNGLQFITSNKFFNIIQDTSSLFFQSDSFVASFKYPSSTDKPDFVWEPTAAPGIPTMSPEWNCSYPNCTVGGTGTCIPPPIDMYYSSTKNGACDLCSPRPPNSMPTYTNGNINLPGDIGFLSNCPYVCVLPRQYKTGKNDSFLNEECIDVPIGYFSPDLKNHIDLCTIPPNFTFPHRLGFGSNSNTNSCMITPAYQIVFVHPDYAERNIIPTNVLKLDSTIEMWIKITSLPSRSTMIGITGIYNSWELSFFYNKNTYTLLPQFTHPVSQVKLFDNSNVAPIPVSSLTNLFFHFAVIIETNTKISFYVNGNIIGSSMFSSTKFSLVPGYQYIGGQQFNRMAFLINEFKTYDRALSPNELGWSLSNEMISHSCNPKIGSTLCKSKCISCDSTMGLSLDTSDCTCKCTSPNFELINNKCVLKCSHNSFRDSATGKCQCIDGQFKVFKTNSIKIQSLYQYDQPNNYYPTNLDLKIGLLSIELLNEFGQPIKPISCSSSSNDVGSSCSNLYDLDSGSFWLTSRIGFGYIILNLPLISTISTISLFPLPNANTMKQISISILNEQSEYKTIIYNSTIPLLASQDKIDFNIVNDQFDSPFKCVSCPTISSVKENSTQLDYFYPPTSNLPRNQVFNCGCFSRYSFNSFSCMPPLPSPQFTLISGSYKTNTIANLIYNINPIGALSNYKLRYTLDSSDPIETSLEFPLQQGLLFDEIKTIIVKVRSFKVGRLTSDVASSIYTIQGLIDCLLSPAPIANTIFQVGITVSINCTTIPAISSISSSWIYYTIDSSVPSVLSNKYNPKYGVELIAIPTIGMNNYTFRVLSQLDQYFSFTGDFLYQIQPIIPPPIVRPLGQINFTNSVPLSIIIPSILDESTVPATYTFYKNYLIYYDLIDQGNTNPPPLNSSSGIKYVKEDDIVIQCNSIQNGCLLHLRAIGCINQACSKVVSKYFKLSFDFSTLIPTIKSKYQIMTKDYQITIKSNSLIDDIKIVYQYKLLPSFSDPTLSICELQFDIQLLNSIEYQGTPFNISSPDKGFFCICSKNFKKFNNQQYSSNQHCKLLVYTYQMDPPIFLQHGEYMGNKLKFNIYEDIRNYKHVGIFRIEVNNDIPNEDSQIISGSSIQLLLSNNLSYQSFSIVAIDCPIGYICSEPTSTSITLRDQCSPPEMSKPTGIYYNNITLYASCDNGCIPVYEYLIPTDQPQELIDGSDTSLSSNYKIFPNGLFLSSPNQEETITSFAMTCINTWKNNSDTLLFKYTIEKYLRPNKPTIFPGDGRYLPSNPTSNINITCDPRVFPQYPNERCKIYFTIKLLHSKSTIPLQINAIPTSPGLSMYDYEYSTPFRPQFVGYYSIVSITQIYEASTDHQQYDFDISTESTSNIFVYGNRPIIEMVPSASEYYPNITVELISSSTFIIDDIIFYYMSSPPPNNSNKSNLDFGHYDLKTKPPLSLFKFINNDSKPIICSDEIGCVIHTFIQGRYYDSVTNYSIQSFSLKYVPVTFDSSNNSNQSSGGSSKSNPNLIYLLLLLIPLLIAGYLIHKYIIIEHINQKRFKQIFKQAMKTGLIIKEKKN